MLLSRSLPFREPQFPSLEDGEDSGLSCSTCGDPSGVACIGVQTEGELVSSRGSMHPSGLLGQAPCAHTNNQTHTRIFNVKNVFK